MRTNDENEEMPELSAGKKRGKTLSVSLCESDWETIQEILQAEVRRCEGLAKIILFSGDEKDPMLPRAQGWLNRAEDIKRCSNAIQDKQDMTLVKFRH